MPPTPEPAGDVVRQMLQFPLETLATLEETLLLNGLLPPVVRGYRLGQSSKDPRPFMGGSDAENTTHYAAFLANLQAVHGAVRPDIQTRILKTLEPFWGRPLIPFPHRAVLRTLAAYGPLEDNPLWAALPGAQQQAARTALFGFDHYYDLEQERMHVLPPNYLWVTAANALIALELSGDSHCERVFDSALNALMGRLHEEIWLDDSPPRVVVDQYAWESVMGVVELCVRAKRAEALEAFLPVAERYFRLYCDFVQDDGYGVSWGRSLGLISYATTLSFMPTVGRALYENERLSAESWAESLTFSVRAFQTLRNDWFDSDGLLTMHKFGRETYVYRRAHRLVGSSFDTLSKILKAGEALGALEQDCSISISSHLPERPPLNRFEVFREESAEHERVYGLWTYHNKDWQLSVPLVGSNRQFEPLISSNYLPAPRMPFWLDVPVQQSAPYGTQFIELNDGSVWAAAEGCDAYRHDEAGLELVWQRWVNIDTLEQKEDIGELRLRYGVAGSRLRLEQAFTAKSGKIRHRYSLLGVALAKVETSADNKYRFFDTHKGASRELLLELQGEFLKANLENVQDLPAGKGFLGPLPWLLTLILPQGSGSHSILLSRRTLTRARDSHV